MTMAMLQTVEFSTIHVRWWDVIWEKAALAGVEEITMTPEHGPPNYQVRTNIGQKQRRKIITKKIHY